MPDPTFPDVNTYPEAGEYPEGMVQFVVVPQGPGWYGWVTNASSAWYQPANRRNKNNLLLPRKGLRRVRF